MFRHAQVERYALIPITCEELGKKVNEYWTPSNRRNLGLLENFLPTGTLQLLQLVILNQNTASGDEVRWKLTGNGLFTSISANQTLCPPNCANRKERKKLWKTEGPQRYSVLLWQV